MTETPAVNRCPYCGADRWLDLTWRDRRKCAGCGRWSREEAWEPPPPLPERDPPMEVLMRAPVTPAHHGGGGNGRRRVEKAGERLARKERRWEQDGGGAPVGRPERTVVVSAERTEDRPLMAKLYADDWRAVEFLCESLSLPEREVTPSKVGRWGVLALLDRAAGVGVQLCGGCGFPMRPAEQRCPACRWRRQP